MKQHQILSKILRTISCECPIIIPKDLTMIEHKAYWQDLPDELKEIEPLSRQAAHNQLEHIKAELKKIGNKATEAKIQKWQEILDFACIKNEEFMALFSE